MMRLYVKLVEVHLEELSLRLQRKKKIGRCDIIRQIFTYLAV